MRQLLRVITAFTLSFWGLAVLLTHGPPAKLLASDAGAFQYALRSSSHFEANLGQANRDIDFLTRRMGHSLYLNPQGFVLELRSSLYDHRTITARLAGANPNVSGLGIGLLPGTTNYYLSSDTKEWVTDVPMYNAVLFENVYDGIDLKYYWTEGNLEFDFYVSPHSDPSAIRLEFEGSDMISVDDRGDLVLAVGDETVRMRAPTVYQFAEGHTDNVAARYFLLDKYSVGLWLGEYDDSTQLIIDPVVEVTYSTYLGGVSSDFAGDVVLGSDGSAYVTGFTTSVNFPVAPVGSGILRGTRDAYVTKFSPDGSTIVYSTFIGGSAREEGQTIGITSDGIYIAGITDSSDFPTTVGAFDESYNGDDDGFIVKLDGAGMLVFASYIGGSAFDTATDLVVDSAGRPVIVGWTNANDFPVTVGAFDETWNGDSDCYVLQMSVNGADLLYSTFLGGSGGDECHSVGIDGADRAHVAGATTSPDFPVTAGALDASLNGTSDWFLAKLNTVGSGLLYGTYLGGSGQVSNHISLALDQLGNAYVAGETDETDFPTTADALQPASNGDQEVFLAKIDSSGSTLLYGTYLGGSAFDSAGQFASNKVAVDEFGNAYVAGRTHSQDFPTTADALQLFNAGSSDVFLAKIDSSGSTLLYGTYLGGSAQDRGDGLYLGPVGDLGLVGFSSSVDFPTTVGAFDESYNGVEDAFVMRFRLALKVSIDVEDGKGANSFSCHKNGVVKVALLSSNTGSGDDHDFEAGTIDPDTLTFGPASVSRTHQAVKLVDVDHDNDEDLVVWFDWGEAGVACGASEVCVEGSTFDGVPLFGCDVIRSVRQ